MRKTALATAVLGAVLLLTASGFGSVTCPGSTFVGTSSLSYSDATNASANCSLSVPGGSITPNGAFTGHTSIGAGAIYDNTGHLLGLEDLEGRTTMFGGPLPGTLQEVSGNAGTPFGTPTFALFYYDSNGRVNSESGSLNSWTYDNTGRLISAVKSFLVTTQYVYDSAGHVISADDGHGHTTNFTYDAAGHIVSSDDSGNTTTYTYDVNGRLIHSVGGTGNITYSYDGFGREIQENSLFVGTTSYTYQGGFGPLTELKFDSYGGFGQSFTEEFTYDVSSGELTGDSVLHTNPADPADGSTSYSYDSSGELVQIQYPGGGLSTFTYDALGELVHASDPEGDYVDFSYLAPTTPTPEPSTLILLSASIVVVFAKRFAQVTRRLS